MYWFFLVLQMLLYTIQLVRKRERHADLNGSKWLIGLIHLCEWQICSDGRSLYQLDE